MDTVPHLVANGGHASLIGSALGGYKVQALIGRGAMGTVYLARDTALNRPVALKVLLGSLARNPSMVRSFYREAQAAAPLRHPCVVRIYSAGVEAGTPYIAMEYVAGEPLDRFLRRKGTVNWQTALYVGAQLARALECAHGAGVIHRDVKPANILLDRQGRVRLTDFGIARVATLDTQANGTNGVIGTPTYMSPEQCEGADLRPATDLYSLGVVLFQMMAGHAPFRAESSHALVKQILTDDAPRLNKLLPEIPDDVARLVAHLLQKEPDARPRSATDVVKTIERLRAEDGGKSVIPEALAAFVREQAVESNLRLMTPPPQRQSRKSNASSDSKRLSRMQRFRTPLVGVTCIFIVSVIAAAITAIGHTSNAPIPAPVLSACRFQDEADGTLRASTVLDGFVFHELHWAGDTLVVEAQGRNGSLLDGATGLLAMDPNVRECRSLHAPSAPFAAEGKLLVPVPLMYRIPPENAGTLGSTVLMTRYLPGDTSAPAYAEVLPQPITSAFPQVTPLHRETLVDVGQSAAIALHPDGRHFCVAERTAEGGERLMEYASSGHGDAEPKGVPITGAGQHIVSGSIQYTADGNSIAYMRQKASGGRELWISSHNAQDVGALLSMGHVDTSYALSPDGTRAVVAVREPDPSQPELHVVDTASGNIVARIGHGTIGSEGWLPTGDAFVITRGAPAQAWLVSPATAPEARQLTQCENGIRGNAAVSPDGRWIAIIANRHSDQSVLFVPIGVRATTLAQADRSQNMEVSL